MGDRRFPSLRLGYADLAQEGTQVVVSGYAHIGELELRGWPGPDPTQRRGPILNRRLDDSPEKEHLQVLDLGLRLAEGLSGAPVLDGRGRVLGLVGQWTQATDPDTGEEVGYSAQAVSSKTLAWWLRKELGPGWWNRR